MFWVSSPVPSYEPYGVPRYIYMETETPEPNALAPLVKHSQVW